MNCVIVFYIITLIKIIFINIISAPSDERRDEEMLYNSFQLAELQDKAPFINWRDHFQNALKIVSRKITDKERVVVYAPKYLEKLTKLIKKYNSTDEGKM